MEYRQLGKSGMTVSVIGLGMEHIEQSSETMNAVLSTAVAAGVSYVDTLYGDPATHFWDCFAPALKPYRSRMTVSAHITDPRFDLPHCESCFEAVLERLGGYADVGLCPMVDDESALGGWVQVSLELLQRHKKQGRIRAVGISSHTPETALKVIATGLVDVLMFGVNLLGHSDESHQALYRACAGKGIGLVAMKPFFGGTLLFADGRPTGITPLQCLDYTLSQPVATTVPGIRNAQQLREILRYLEVSEAERDYRPALANIHTHLAGTCVYCNHCLPCPQGIDVGNTIMMADWARAGMTDDLHDWYAGLPAKASACIECGQCSARCPFSVDVIPRMREAAAVFEG